MGSEHVPHANSRGMDMVDESRDLEPDIDETVDDELEPENRRSLFGVIIATIVIIVIILVFLMLRSCDSATSETTTTGGGQSIIAVKGLLPEPGAISVWVKEDTSIDALLLTADIRASDVVNMDGGRFVVAVPEGTENEAMRKLAKVAGVVDTGRVYGDGQAAE